MRFEDWPQRLENEIQVAQNLVFQWGVNDCLLWTASIVKSITGVDHAQAYRGKYRTRSEAVKLLIDLGFHSTADAVTNKLRKHDSVLMAQRGDVVFFDGAIGICIGDRCMFLTDHSGLAFVPLNLCAAAWAVE